MTETLWTVVSMTGLVLAVAGLVLNLVTAVWAWRMRARYWRAHRALSVLCLQAWPLRRHRQLGVEYFNTMGHWMVERDRGD